MQLNLPPLAAEARLKNDIKATKTVAMAIAVYYICYIPIIVFSIWRRNEERRVSNLWYGFMLIFATFLSSALNPIIYVLRSRRHRSAFRQLVKDPCGTSAYRENPVKQEKEAKPQREKKPQIEGEEIKDCRHPGTAAVRPGQNPGNDTRATRKPTTGNPNPGNDTRTTGRPTTEHPNSGNDTRTTRRPTTAKRQIQPSHSVVKMAWEKNEEDCGNLGEEVAVAEQVRRDSKKVHDEDVKSSG